MSNGPFVMMDKLKTATEAVDFYLCAQKNQTILIQYMLQTFCFNLFVDTLTGKLYLRFSQPKGESNQSVMIG